MASYFVIGDNGAKYGPADEFVLQEWIGQNRLSSKMQLENVATRQRLLAGYAPELIFPENQRLAPLPNPIPVPGQSPSLAFQGAGAYGAAPRQQWQQAPSATNYYRPVVDADPGAMPASDRSVGTVVMVLSALGAAIFGVLFFMAASFDSAAMKGGAEAHAYVTGYVTGVLLACTLTFAVGNGIRQSRRWAFVVGIILFGLNVAMNLLSGRFLGIFISGWLLYYCIARMSGKKGPLPV